MFGSYTKAQCTSPTPSHPLPGRKSFPHSLVSCNVRSLHPCEDGIYSFLQQDLGYLLQVVRAKNVKSRERRQQGRGLVMSNRRCRFIEFSNEEVMGTCFYDFGGYIACKSGNNLSFDAAECPRRPDRYAG